MAGHSKWKNIMHKKEKTDMQRAKIFTKIGKEMQVAIKEGGADPNTNNKLKDLIAKAKANNVPNDNIERIIKKAEGGSDDLQYEVLFYEGYGPSGIAVIAQATTENRNRTGADIRHSFDKFGGNLGQTGCVSYLFSDKGVIVINAEGVDEDSLIETALEAGAEDVLHEDKVFEVLTEPSDFSTVRETLENAGYTFISCELDKLPSNYVTLTNEEDKIKMTKLLEMLEDNDDVVGIWHNWEEEDSAE